MRFTSAISAIALASVVAAQDPSSWADASMSSTYEVTTTITKTLQQVYTETSYGPSPTSTTTSASSTTHVSTKPTASTPVAVATPTGVSGAAAMPVNVALAIVAAGAAAFWSS